MCKVPSYRAVVKNAHFQALGCAVCLAIPLAMLGSNSASASCGDWLAHPARDVADSESFDQDKLIAGLLAQTPVAAKNPRPCNGANCRGSRPIPAQPTPVSPAPTWKDYGCPIRLVEFPAEHLPELLQADFCIGTLSRLTFRIDRPPKV